MKLKISSNLAIDDAAIAGDFLPVIVCFKNLTIKYLYYPQETK